MAASNVISVNPVQKTLGALHPEVLARLARRRINYTADSRSSHRSLNFFFAVKELKGGARSFYLLLARLAVATLFIISGAMALSGNFDALSFAPEAVVYSSVFGIIMTAVGSMLALGMLTRPLMGLSMLAWIALSTFAAINGSMFMEGWLWAACSLVFCICGAGRFSLDTLARHAIYKVFFGRRRQKRIAARRLSYKAFSCTI